MLLRSSTVGAEVKSGSGIGGDDTPTVGASPPLSLREHRFEVRISTFSGAGMLFVNSILGAEVILGSGIGVDNVTTIIASRTSI
jgi:hypothetical protein